MAIRLFAAALTGIGWLRGCAGALALAACTTGGTPVGPAGGSAPAELQVGYSALRISLPVFVAKQRGLFSKHGLRVELKRYETAQPLVEEVLDGRIMAAGYAALPIILTAASRDRSRVVLAGAMVEDAAHPVSYLLRAKGANTIVSAAALRGARIGILPTIAYRRWLDAILGQAGLDPDQVAIIPTSPAQQVSSLANGGIDSLFSNDPMATAALISGVAEPVGAPAPVAALAGGSMVFGSFLMHPRLTEERPQAVTLLMRALDEAVALINLEPGSTRDDMRPYVRQAELAFVKHYPPASYLSSEHFDDAALQQEVNKQLKLGALQAGQLLGNQVSTYKRGAAASTSTGK